jgi:FkbM family methyltransferase
MKGDDQTERLPLWLGALGWFMRRIPRGPRKLEYWWWLLFQRIGCGRHINDPGERDWPGKKQFAVRGRHGVMMITGVGTWVGRWQYFRGSFFQDDLVSLLENLIRRGDIVIDAGANLGYVTSLAARLTGPSGSVHAFEPNPKNVGVIEYHVKLNNFKNVNIIEAGLSDREGGATMVATANAAQGWVSLDGHTGGEDGFGIRLVRGDDVLGGLESSRPVILKMDVEGHEVHALRGFSRLLERRELAVICEINREALARSASSPEELIQLMKDRGFSIFRFGAHQSRWRRSLKLAPLEGPDPDDNYDALFLRPGTSLWHRLLPD